MDFDCKIFRYLKRNEIPLIESSRERGENKLIDRTKSRVVQYLIRAVWKPKGKFECQPIVSIGCFAKDTFFNKDTSLNKDESRARSTVVPIPTKIPPKGQRVAMKGEHVARIDVGTIEVIDRMINRRDL